MIRSVLKLTHEDFKHVCALLPKEKPKLSTVEREKLVEVLLEYFEKFTNAIQGDSITISKVYPAVSGLKVYYFDEKKQ